MPSERRNRDRTKERDKERVKEQSSRDSLEKRDKKSSRDKERDKHSSSRSKESSSSKSSKESDRKSSRRESKDKVESKHKEIKASKSRNGDENYKQRIDEVERISNSKSSRHKKNSEEIPVDNDNSEISEENIRPPQRKKSVPIIEERPPENNEDEYNYEDDDFEDYDEDFEEDDDDIDDESEDEEEEEDDNGHGEKKMDSGNYDQPSRQAAVRMQKELDAVKEAMKKENSISRSPNRNEISDDSGRESPGSPKKSNVREEPRKQSGFINFSAAKERNKVQIAAKAANSRGSELLQMIKLDIVDFDLFDLPPIRYEAFMKTFGSSNSQQSSTQTGEDNLEVEVQTEDYTLTNKWTQKPPTFGQKTDMEDINSVRGNLLGVGGDKEDEDVGDIEYKQNNSSLRLAKFLCGAGQALTAVLEEDLARKEGEMVEGLPQRDIDFADSITVLRIDETPCLAGKPVTIVEFSSENPLTLVTVHGRDDNLCYVSQWHVSRPHYPLQIFKSSSLVTSVCITGNFVIGGCNKGEVLVWDTRESLSKHHQVTEDHSLVARSPTFANTDAHSTKVTSIKHLNSGHGDHIPTYSEHSKHTASQLITLEQSGQLVIWTVLDYQSDYEQHLGLAHWGQVRMVASSTISLDSFLMSDLHDTNEFQCHDITMDPIDPSRFYVASDGGMVLHGSTQADHRPSPRLFKPEIETSSSVSSLAFCPYDEPFMLLGSEDGSIRLHSTNNDRPLITWAGTVDNEPIVKTVWSTSRPCVFFILDTANRIHLWDLGAGDIYPAHTVQFGDKINSFSLSWETGEPGIRQMLAVGLEEGRVEVMHLKTDYRAEDEDSCDRELERFLHYVSII